LGILLRGNTGRGNAAAVAGHALIAEQLKIINKNKYL
jgi:hypothetical protein